MTLLLTARVPARGLAVDLQVAAGETVALVGPNGAGKSTVLGLIAGLIRPADGRVTLGSRTLTWVESGRVRDWVAPHDRHIALLAQDPLLFPHLSVRDNVAFGPRSRGVGRREARAAAHRWLQAVGATELAGRRPAGLSGGQAQRVAVARALAAEPSLLLLDEPMAALDVTVAPALRQTLRRVLADRTAVVATHDVLDALLLAERVVVLDGGEVVEFGPTAEVLSRPRSAFAARIAGLNMVRGRWRDGAVETETGRRIEGMVAGPEASSGDLVVAVFRPAAVSVYPAVQAGSPRNKFEVVVTDLEPHGGWVRVHAGEFSADITPRAVADLSLAPGSTAVFSVKATEISVYLT